MNICVHKNMDCQSCCSVVIKRKQLYHQKNCWQLLTSIITIIIQMTETMATLTIFTFTSEKTAEISKWRKWFLYFYSVFNLTLHKLKTGHPSSIARKMNRFCRNKYTLTFLNYVFNLILEHTNHFNQVQILSICYYFAPRLTIISRSFLH